MITITPKSLRASPKGASALRLAGTTRLGGGCLLLASLAFASLAQAQSAPASSESLTWNGITLYGIVDIGLQYQTYGAPANDYFPAATNTVIQKSSRQSITAVTPSNLSQSRVGLSGNEPIPGGDWAAVFRLETYFNPQSGNIADAVKSITQNNGRTPGQQTTNVDSSVDGQAFSIAYAGISSATWGTITFGRQTTLMADGVSKYDPMGGAQAFSLIGFSGTAPGGGDTEDKRLDEMLKYTAKYNFLHFGALYQFSGATGSTNTAYQFQLGGDFAGLSADAFYAKKYNAVAASALSLAQVNDLAIPLGTPGSLNCAGCTAANTVAATVSDNQTYGVMASYALQNWKFFGGYENITFNNPNNPYVNGQDIEGGYKIVVATATPYPKAKVYDYWWVGVKWTVLPQLDLAAGYYEYTQNAYAATGPDVGCSTKANSKCSGSYKAASFLADYRFTKRFDGYFGTIWSGVYNGVANGYDFATNNISTTVGIRFKF